MADNVSRKRRSEIMSNIKSKDTSIELLVRRALFALGYRYRIHYKKLPGKPDIVFTKKKVAIFINGCFWHGHEECKYVYIPKTRTNYWKQKIERNKERDAKNYSKLNNMGWTILVTWECNIRDNLDETIEYIVQVLDKH